MIERKESSVEFPSLLALPEDLRTVNWTEITPYPELVYQNSEEHMNHAYAK